jgi:hypothetical protein
MTAVDFLVQQIINKHRMAVLINNNNEVKLDIPKDVIEVAKAMEKEQHGNTWDEAINTHERRGHVIARSIVDFDDYYNENYNK